MENHAKAVQGPMSRDVMELLTVAVEYCALLERAGQVGRRQLVDTLLRLLPLLYLKGVLLPPGEHDEWVDLPDYVSEENYEIVRQNVALAMGGADDCLDVFVEDMKYSDQPILRTVSETLADIYQDLKNFACALKDGLDEMQAEAVVTCREAFERDWGQKAANVLRALHEVRYGLPLDDEDDETYGQDL